MKRHAAAVLALALLAAACSSEKTLGQKLKSGTPAYVLAKDLASILPVLDPDKNAVLATAEDFEVTVGDVIAFIQESAGNQAASLKQYDAAHLKGLITQYVNQIGERALLLESVAAAKTSVSEEEVDKGLAAGYAQSGGEEKYLDGLKANGIAFDFVRRNFKENLLIQRFFAQNVFNTIQIADEELRKAYDEDKTASVRHILFMTQGKSDVEKAAIRKKMEGILARAKKGEDFASLVKQFTEDIPSKEKGGLYESFGRGAMVKAFEDASFSVPVGQISDIVETEYGYHIIKVEGRQKETRPFEEAKAEIEAKIREPRQSAAFKAYLDGLKAEAKLALAAF
jgi:foldase protein PrsA